MRQLVIVGTLTRPTPYFAAANGAGITVFALDTQAGQLDLIWEQAGIDNPTYLAFDPQTSTIYAVSEVFGWNEGTVSAYRIDPISGRLAYRNKQPTLGSLPAHASVDIERRRLLVTNYSHETADEVPGQAVAIYAIGSGGDLSQPGSGLRHRGQGPRLPRQGVPHPHCALVHPDGECLSVADLGLDKILHYPIDETGSVGMQPIAECRLAPGDGPRHFVYTNGGRNLHVINELSCSITSFVQAGTPRTWKRQQSFSTLPGPTETENLCADIQVSPDGRFLYGSNRGHDSIVAVALDRFEGPAPIGWTSAGGRTPRSLTISSDGNIAIVANQDSDTITVFRRDPGDGLIGEMLSRTAIGTPMFVKAISAIP